MNKSLLNFYLLPLFGILLAGCDGSSSESNSIGASLNVPGLAGDYAIKSIECLEPGYDLVEPFYIQLNQNAAKSKLSFKLDNQSFQRSWMRQISQPDKSQKNIAVTETGTTKVFQGQQIEFTLTKNICSSDVSIEDCKQFCSEEFSIADVKEGVARTQSSISADQTEIDHLTEQLKTAPTDTDILNSLKQWQDYLKRDQDELEVTTKNLAAMSARCDSISNDNRSLPITSSDFSSTPASLKLRFASYSLQGTALKLFTTSVNACKKGEDHSSRLVLNLQK